MSAGTIAAIVVAVVVVVALVLAAMAATRRRRLRQRFGLEYDRLVSEQHSRRKAQAELADRERRVQGLDIRPLSAASRADYAAQWTGIQEQFVDEPADAAAQAQLLVVTVMNERGYPTGDPDQMAADLSVGHANMLDHYRSARGISEQAAAGTASTEDLRQAVIHYRELFGELLGERAGMRDLLPDARSAEPAAAQPAPVDAAAAADDGGESAGQLRAEPIQPSQRR